jgi:hypothetical protein
MAWRQIWEAREQRGSEAEVYDHYRSVRDPSLMIFVVMDAVPPFRFKAGGWELVKISIDLGPVMMARVAEKGYFLCRVADNQAGWAELPDIPSRLVEPETQDEANDTA